MGKEVLFGETIFSLGKDELLDFLPPFTVAARAWTFSVAAEGVGSALGDTWGRFGSSGECRIAL